MLIFYSKALPASDPSFWPNYWKANVDVVSERINPEYAAFVRHVPPGVAVLDAGCGTGFVTRAMRQRGYRAFGIDFDQTSVTRSARERGYFPGAVADVTRLPYGDRIFDAVFVCSVAEHVPSGAEVAIRECGRVLRPGGTVVLTLPYVNLVRKLYAPFYALRCRLRARRGPLHFDQFVYTRAEVMRLLRDSGFEILECKRSHYTTVLFRIPGVKALHRRVFPTPVNRPAAPAGKQSQIAAAPATGGVKQLVKKVLEGILNRVIPNRLTVVARKVS
jgi:SAM-dependent methyltransferase